MFAFRTPAQSNQLYRVRQPKPGLDLIRMSELMGAVFADVPCGQKPHNPRVPKGEWYCENSDCAVREVQVRMKHFDKVPKRLPTLNCPVDSGSSFTTT